MLLSDVCLTSDVCLSVAYVGANSRTERPRKTKISTEVAHVTHASDTMLRSNGQRSRSQVGGDILWRPPAQLVQFSLWYFVFLLGPCYFVRLFCVLFSCLSVVPIWSIIPCGNCYSISKTKVFCYIAGQQEIIDIYEHVLMQYARNS